MGYTYIGDSRVKQIYLGNTRITKGYLGDKLIFSASNPVTYHIDVTSHLSVIREVDYGDSVLSYTPATPGSWDSSWKFVGWRTDKTASGSVLKSQTMGTEPIVLYAVFKQDIVRHFISYDTTYRTESVYGTRYYNNGNTVNPDITVPTGKLTSGWTWRGWSAGGTASGDATVAFSNGSVMKGVTTSGTHYGLYYLTGGVTVSYHGNGATSGSVTSETKHRYRSASGNYKNPVFTIKSNGYAKACYKFSKWGTSTTGGTIYTAGQANVSLTSNLSLYALWTPVTTQIWTGTIEQYGSTDTPMPVVVGTFDLTDFSSMKLVLKMKNPNLSGTVIIYINGSKVKEYKHLQFSENTDVTTLEPVDIRNYGKNCYITITRGGHDGKTEITGTLTITP